MADLPHGWVSEKLGKVTTSAKGKKPKDLRGAPWDEACVPYIDIRAFEAGDFRQYAMPSDARVCEKDDVLIVWDGARSGLTGIGYHGALGSTIAALQSEASFPHYLRAFLQNQYEYINTHTKGTGIPHVDPDILWDIDFPVAPLPEQKRIVEKLQKLLPHVDSCRERLDRIPAILKRFRQSVLAAACSGKLTEDWRNTHDAKEWEETTLDALTVLVTSGSRGWAKYYADSGPRFIRAQNLSHDELDLSDVAHVKLPKKAEGARTLISTGDILITITGANVTKTALVKQNVGEAYVNQHVALVRLANPDCSSYIWLWAVSPAHGRQQLLDSAYGAGKPGLNLSQIRNLSINLPLLEEQQEIVQRVNALFQMADALEKRYEAGNAAVDKLTQSILAKTFRGELVPQNPDDEPASVLLENIKGKRNDNKSAKKKQ